MSCAYTTPTLGPDNGSDINVNVNIITKTDKH
jgi:hypothetical protein